MLNSYVQLGSIEYPHDHIMYEILSYLANESLSYDNASV